MHTHQYRLRMTSNTTKINVRLSTQLNLSVKQIAAAVSLLQADATVPFIARYRKEMTGGLNEVQITAIRNGLIKLLELEKRREYILNTIEDQGKLTSRLREQIEHADAVQLEDLYLPYKSKRKTRASMAQEKGLLPLAKIIMAQNAGDPTLAAQKFVNAGKGVHSPDEAIAGARDIIAEWVNENAKVRAQLRRLFENTAILQSKAISGKKTEAAKYRDYFDWREPAKRIASHRFLAIQRGVNEGLLRMSMQPETERALQVLERIYEKGNTLCTQQVRQAYTDAYKRLLRPSLETEIRNSLKERADAEAIKVFAINLRELLMAPPLGAKNVMALDPGFRSGCKLTCLNKQGKLLHYETIYPFDRNNIRRFEAISVVEECCEKYEIEAIAVGNGTAGRESMQFLEGFVKQIDEKIMLVQVDESGASIYSASEVAREEFPDLDLTVRGSVSIGRRLMDPLAELVKIDPKAIGVGQYQHDVDQKNLRQSLDDVVMSCVNSVGVEVNTAGAPLLTYLSGMGPKLAQRVVAYRDKNGAFGKKNDLKKVNGIGEKAFEQIAGFIRLSNAKNPLDRSAVHPESYNIVKQMAKDLNCTIEDLVKDENLRKKVNLEAYISKDVGLPTLKDIIDELAKPGRDPRADFEQMQFDENINDIADLKVGMVLPGIITNVTNFGAFVDIGVHQSGLVHVSHLVDGYVSDPKKVVKVRQKVKVKVLEIDLERKRIALSMKEVG